MRNPIPVTFYRLGASSGHWHSLVPGAVNRGRPSLGVRTAFVDPDVRKGAPA
jgi:hypothetical protein